MSRRSLSSILSHEDQSLEDVWDWYTFQRRLVSEEKSRVLGAEAASRGLDAAGKAHLWDQLEHRAELAAARYLFKTREELEDDFDRQLAELKRLTMLRMLTSTEASLRVDFIERVNRRKKDRISRQFRQLFQRRRENLLRIRLEEDILDTWRDSAGGAVGGAVSEFKGALNLRHWLAHGRYWKPKLGRASGYDPEDVFDICKQLLQAVGLMPPDPP